MRGAAAVQPRDPAQGHPRVLVVDDDHDTLEMVALFLQFQGFEVTTATNGAEGLAAAPGRFDAITTDLAMPCMDGCEFIQRLRALPLEPVPIIVMTAQEPDPSITECIKPCRVLTKPFDLEALAGLLLSLTTTPAGQEDQGREGGVSQGRHTQMNRQIDDYSVFEKPGGTTWGVCGLKLSTDILTFGTRGEATARGTALARAARVSLWYEPTTHRRDGVLVASFRDEKVL